MNTRIRRRVYDVLEPGTRGDTLSIAFDRFSIFAIIASIACAVIATDPDLSSEIQTNLTDAEYGFGLFFVVEYLARLWLAPEDPLLGKLTPWQCRIRFALQPLLILDFLGALPFVLLLAAPEQRETILMLQVLRFFRLARYSPALATVGRVFASEWRPLMAAGVIGLGMLLMAASAMYLIEHDVQPEHFGSVPQAMYWAVVTLATVGYGDVVPVTPLGKMVTGMVIVAGLVFFALPVAIIATGFISEIRRRDFIVSYGMVARVPLFSGLDAAAISELASMLKARKVPRDAVIMRKGDDAESMYFIANGEVEVILPDRGVRLYQGDFFGEMAVLGRTKRNATVIARSSCELLVLDAADVLKFIEENPRVEAALHEVMAARRGPGGTSASASSPEKGKE
jgi:voltage-gated potassium channel